MPVSPSTWSESGSPADSEKISTTIAYYAAFVTLGMIGVALGPTLPDLAENTRANISEISYLFAARSFGRLLGSFQAGRFYDRLSGHTLMAIMLVITAGLTALIPLIPLLWLLAAILLIQGMAQGAVDVGGNTLIVWVHRDKVGPFMNGLHFSFGVGAFLSPIIIAQAVLISGDITWAFWVLALLTLPVIIWLLRVPSPAPLKVSEDGAEGQVNRLLVTLIAVFFFLYVGTEISFGGWIFTYAVTLDLTEKTMAAYLTAAFFGTVTLGRLLAIPMAVRFRPRMILAADFAGCLASMAIILLWPDSATALWLGALGLGLSMASIFPTTLSLAERRMTITGQVTSWFLLGGSAGGMLLPWLIGQLFEFTGPQATMFTILVVLILAAGVLAVVIRVSKN